MEDKIKFELAMNMLEERRVDRFKNSVEEYQLRAVKRASRFKEDIAIIALLKDPNEFADITIEEIYDNFGEFIAEKITKLDRSLYTTMEAFMDAICMDNICLAIEMADMVEIAKELYDSENLDEIYGVMTEIADHFLDNKLIIGNKNELIHIIFDELSVIMVALGDNYREKYMLEKSRYEDF